MVVWIPKGSYIAKLVLLRHADAKRGPVYRLTLFYLITLSASYYWFDVV